MKGTAAAVAGTEEQEWTLVKRGAKVVAPCDKDRVIVVGGVPAGLHVANVSADSVVSLATEVTRTVSPEPCYGGSRKKNTRRAHEARGGAGGADDICVVDECARASAVIVPDAVVPQAATHPTACGGGAVASALKACVAAAAASGDSADYDCERYSSDSAARWVAIIMQAFRDSKRVLTDRAVTTLIEIFKKAAVDDGAVSITKVMSDLKSTAASLTKKCAEYRASSQQKKFLNVFTASMYGPTGDCRMLMSHAEELFQTPASAMCTLEFSAKWVAINRQCEGAAASIVVKHAMVLTELRKQLEAVAEKDPLRAEFKQVIEAAQTYTQAINEGYTVISALCKRLSLMGNLITLLLKTEQYGSAVNGALHCSLFAICNSESKSKELLCYGQDYLVITALKKNQLTNFFMKLILQYKSSLFAGIHGKRDVNNYLSDLSAKLNDAEVIRKTLLDYLGARWRTLSVREDITDNVIEGFLTQWITESFAPLADEKLSPMSDPLIRLMTLRITINNFLATVETINAQEKVVLLRMEYCLKRREGELIKRLILSLTGKDSDSEVIDQLGRILNLEAHSHEGRYKTQFTAYVNSLLATTTTGSAEVLKDCVMRFVMSYNKHALPALSDADHDSFLTGYYQLNCISELNRNIAALGSLASSGVCDCSLVTFFLMLFQEKGIEGASESFVHELYFLFEQHVQRYYGTLPLPIGQRKALYDLVQLEEHTAPLLEGIVSREPLSVGQKFFQQLILILDNIFRASPRGDAFFVTKPADYADMKRLLLESLRDDAAVLAPAAGGAGGAAAAAGLA